ncbi:hypothetical protein ACIQVU_19365 [Lysinibacillus sp. NPDC098008]|uniref:hypothetical protein n=1 Tax=Lysinibacillus sp. NPDC098008 TaxID=3364146 RepID=UPI0037FE8EE9
MERTLEEVVQIISDFVAGEIEENEGLKTEYKTAKNDIFGQVESILNDVKVKAALRKRKANIIKKELDDLLKKQAEIADKLVVTEDEAEIAELEREITEHSTRRLTLEAKLNAFSTSRVGLSLPEQRLALKKKLHEFDSVVSSAKPDLSDLAKTLKAAVEKAIEPIEKASRLFLLGTRERELTGIDQLIKNNKLSLFATDQTLQLLKTENEKRSAFSAWLDSTKNISFEDFIPAYLEKERLRTEQWQREQEEQKLKAAREREERNAKAMASIENNLGKK